MTRLLLLATALLLSSCFDIREEIWIEPDGSGRAVIDYQVPTSALGMMGGEEGVRDQVNKVLAAAPELALDKLTLLPDGRQTTIHAEVSTDSMLSLIDLPQSDAFQDLPAVGKEIAGTFDVRMAGLQIDMVRRVDIKRALGIAVLGMGRDDRQNRSIEYIIHLPAAAKEHNADLTKDSGKTLIWDRTLGEALDEPIVCNLKAPIPIPWWAFATVALLLILLAWGLIKLFLRLRTPKPAAPTA